MRFVSARVVLITLAVSLAVPSVAESPVYVVRQGDTLWELAAKHYGNRHYSKVLALHNQIATPRQLTVGDTIRLSSLREILEEEGLAVPFARELDAIISARESYCAAEPTLCKLREAAPHVPGDPGTPRPTLILPDSVEQALSRAAEQLDEVADRLAALTGDEWHAPPHAVGQLRSAAVILAELASGANDGYGYDMDMVHQRLAWALYNIIIWARNGFK